MSSSTVHPLGVGPTEEPEQLTGQTTGDIQEPVKVYHENIHIGDINVVNKTTTFKDVRRLIEDNVDETLHPELYRMKLNNNDIIQKSNEKNATVELNPDDNNVLYLVGVNECLDGNNELSYEMGGKSIRKHRNKTSSIFTEHIDVLKHPDELPFKLVFNMILYSLIVSLLIGIWLVFDGSIIFPQRFTDEGTVNRTKTEALDGLLFHASCMAIINIFLYPISTTLSVVFAKNNGLKQTIKKLPIGYLVVSYALNITTWGITFNLSGPTYQNSRLQLLFLILILGAVTFLSTYFYEVGKVFQTNFSLQMSKVFGCLSLIFCGLSMFGGIQALLSIKRKTTIAVILVIFPIVKEILYAMVRASCRGLHIRNQEADIVIIYLYLLFMGFVNRFLYTTFDDVQSILLTALLNAFLEILFRQSHENRDRMQHQFINYIKRQLKMTTKHSRDFDSQEYKQHKTRTLLCEMECEYIAIMLTPLTIIVYYPDRLFYDFGYAGYYDELKYELLFHGLIIQLGLEIIVDVLNMKVETKFYNYDFNLAWQNKFYGYSIVLFSSVFVAYSFFIVSFNNFLLFQKCPSEYFCMCKNPDYSNVITEYCDEWLNKTNNGELYGLNSTEYGF